MTAFAPLNSRDGISWHCVYTKPQAEVLAEVQLRQQGFAAWAPMEARKVNRQLRIVPLFPRYLFVQFDCDDESWGPVANTRGVSMLLRSPSGRPLDVPQVVMERLAEQCAPNGVIYPAEQRELRRGDTGRVADGPFAEFSGICTRTTRDRVWLLLAVFGSREVEFKREAVELVG